MFWFLKREKPVAIAEPAPVVDDSMVIDTLDDGESMADGFTFVTMRPKTYCEAIFGDHTGINKRANVPFTAFVDSEIVWSEQSPRVVPRNPAVESYDGYVEHVSGDSSLLKPNETSALSGTGINRALKKDKGHHRKSKHGRKDHKGLSTALLLDC